MRAPGLLRPGATPLSMHTPQRPPHPSVVFLLCDLALLALLALVGSLLLLPQNLQFVEIADELLERSHLWNQLASFAVSMNALAAAR